MARDIDNSWTAATPPVGKTITNYSLENNGVELIEVGNVLSANGVTVPNDLEINTRVRAKYNDATYGPYSNVVTIAAGGSGWDISGAAYSGNSISVSAQDGTPNSVAFNNDGTKMYVLGSVSTEVYQYTLSTPWDVSTATYDTVFLDVSPETGAQVISGMWIGNSGSKLYVCGYTTKGVWEYTLSTPYNLSTASYSSNTFVPGVECTNIAGAALSADGTKMYLASDTDDAVYQYTLSTPFNVSTSSYASKSLDVSTQTVNVYDIAISPTGDKLLVAGRTSGFVFQYTLSTPGDLATATYDSVSAGTTTETSGNLRGLWIGNNAGAMYVTSASNDTVFQYTL